MSDHSISKSLAWARLIRVPNLFTAQADVYVGLIATGALLHQPLAATALIFASTGLYAGGVVLNDVMDIAEDRRDRPSRPLPSGAISIFRATSAAFGLMAAGATLAMAAALLAQRNLPIVVAIGLIVTILAYDLWGKRTVIGPMLLGVCRFLNVLLGWTLAVVAPWSLDHGATWVDPLLTAGVMGSYVWALSSLAKHETAGLPTTAARWRIGLMFVPLGLMIWLAARQNWGDPRWIDAIRVAMYTVLAISSIAVLARVWRASQADVIGRAVGGLLSLIILVDAAMIATLGHGIAALLILALYVPVMTLRRRIYMT